MSEPITLNPNHSTTRLVRQTTADTVISELKANQKPEDTFETVVFLPEGDGRKGEGGLRTHSYFKQSLPEKPLISIITVVFNGEQYLEETILSVINQSYDNIEYIVIDAGSTDATLDIIRKYDHAIDYWVSEKDKGIYDAMNKGITLCIGDIIGIINADDAYTDNAINTIAKRYLNHFDSVIHGDIEYITKIERWRVKSPKELSLLPSKMIINHPSVFVPALIYQKHGMFDLSYRIAADWDLMLRFSKNHIKFHSIDIIMVYFLYEGVSSKISVDLIRERFRIRLNYSSYLFAMYFGFFDYMKLFFQKTFPLEWYRKMLYLKSNYHK